MHKKLLRSATFYTVIVLAIVVILNAILNFKADIPQITAKQYEQALQNGKLTEIHVAAKKGAFQIDGMYKDSGKPFVTLVSSDPPPFHELNTAVDNGLTPQYTYDLGDPLWLMILKVRLPKTIVPLLILILLAGVYDWYRYRKLKLAVS